MAVRTLLLGTMMLGSLSAAAQVPTITSMTPLSGPVGATVTITGTNFSAVSANNLVYFGATKATVATATTSGLSVTVPSGANYKPVSVTVNGLTAYTKPFMVTFAGSGPMSNSTFASKVDFNPRPNPAKIGIADFDGDGKSDFAVTSLPNAVVSVFRNIGSAATITSGSFASKIDFACGNGSNEIDVGDLDGDGKLDMVIVNGSDNTISVLRNASTSGSISFNSKVDYATGTSPQEVRIGDVDGDGKPEILTTNLADNTLSIFRNSSTMGSIGPASFSTRVDFNTGTSPSGIGFADLDLDGKKDVAIANSGSNSVSVLRNASTSGSIDGTTLSTRVDFTVGSLPEGIATADLDLDGREDIVVYNGGGNSVSVLRNTHTAGTITTGSFAAKVDFSTGVFQSAVRVSDIDGDGKLDIVVDNTSTNVSVLRNTCSVGTISFATKVDFPVGTDPAGFDIGDLDGDGKPDLVVANYTSSTASVLRNTILALEPAAQSPGPIIFSHITSTAFDGSFAEPTPAPDGYLVLMSGNVAPNFVPVDGISYGYNDIVGSVSSNNIYVVQNTGFPGFGVSNLSPTTIFFKVYAFNGTGPTTNYLTSISPLSGSQVPTADPTPPVVASNGTPNTIAPNTAIDVTANFTDVGSGVKNAVLQYRPIAGAAPNNFTSVAMNNISGATYGATIPANEVTELGIEYKFLVSDYEPNNNSATQILYRTRIRYAESFGLKIPYTSRGRAVSNYRIIAVPLVLDDKSVTMVFGSWLDVNDPTIWAMYRYDGTRYAELNGDSQIEMGKGYWILTPVSTDLGSGPGITADVHETSPFQITLEPGWNQIGNPYNFDISWADVLAANPTKVSSVGANSKIRVFRGTASDVDELFSFEGGFVKNTSTSNVTLDIPVEKNTSINGRKYVQDKLLNAIDQPTWEVMFSLKQGEMEYVLGGLGMRPEANLDFDTYDDFNLPRFIDYLELKFPKERVGMTYTKDVVPTTENFVWKFSVESSMAGDRISLGWNNSYFGSAKEILLLDIATHRAIDMREESSFGFIPGPSREFKVIYGNEDFVRNELIPDRIVLYDPFPNPFVNQVYLDYSLPVESVTQPVEIAIYSTEGVKVSSVNAPGVAGAGRWIWEGGDKSPGLYFVRLSMGDQIVTKKILKQ